MTKRVTSRRCAATGLRLLANAPQERWYRIAKRRYHPISAPMREAGHDAAGWGRYDAPGETLYMAAEPTSAYAEVLSYFKRIIGAVDPLAADAEAVGLTRDEFLEEVATEWQERSFMGVGAIAAIWRQDRSMFEVYAEGAGWWVDVEHPDSLSALEQVANDLLVKHAVTSLTTAVLRGENRDMTTGLATEDADRPSDLPALASGPIFVTDENLVRAADRFRIRVF